MKSSLTITAALSALVATSAGAATYQLTGADTANQAIPLSSNYVFAQASSNQFEWDTVSDFSVGNVVLDSDGLVDEEFYIDATWLAATFSFDADNGFAMSESGASCVLGPNGNGGFFCGASNSVRMDVLNKPATITMTAGGFTWDSGPQPGFSNRLILNFTQVVPAPAAVWLLSSAVAGLSMLRRRQAA
jgi:hypothetical protein